MFKFVRSKFNSIDYKRHVIVAILIRFLLIQYAVIHDSNSVVQYTDIDYGVFTDAARFVLNNSSPYNRHTYRYSPIIAVLLTPNIFLCATFGKYLFSFIDIVAGLLIRSIVKNSLKDYEAHRCKNEKKQLKLSFPKQKKKLKSKTAIDIKADLCMLIWIYNPLTIAIATRGNCDSMAGLLVLATLYFLQCKRQSFLAGLIHGLAVHFRLYPIAYSLTYFMYLSKFAFYSDDCRKNRENSNSIVSQRKPVRTVFQLKYFNYLLPNSEQIKLVTGTLLSLTFLTGFFYLLYGYQFLYESSIYHLIRKDTRHNFSLFFYLQYLIAEVKNAGVWHKVLPILPQIILLIVFSIRYGLNKLCLNFAILLETIVMIAYNSVLTSQYFLWVLAVLPLSIWQIRMSKKAAGFLILIWISAQIAWLLPAYFLEFQGQNTFLFIWIQSVSFFCANMAILGRLIKSFMPVSMESKERSKIA